MKRSPDSMCVVVGQFGTEQFGTKIKKTGLFGTNIVKTDNLAPGQFGTNIIKPTIWHHNFFYHFDQNCL